jgi:hypothetical protein
VFLRFRDALSVTQRMLVNGRRLMHSAALPPATSPLPARLPHCVMYYLLHVTCLVYARAHSVAAVLLKGLSYC